MRSFAIVSGFIVLWALILLQNPFSKHSKPVPVVSLNTKGKSPSKNAKCLFPSDFGTPYMTQYQFQQSDIQIWAISQDNNGEMIMAHRQGIVIFDGRNEENVKVSAIPIVLKLFEDQNLTLLGCDNQYGYLQRNKFGKYEYHVLSEKSLLRGEITDIKITNEFIYFYSDKTIFRHRKDNLKFDNSWSTSSENVQNGMIQIGNDIYISVQNKGLYKFTGDGKKKFVPKTSILAQAQLVFSLPHTKSSVIIGTLNNRLYTFNGSKIEDFASLTQNYIAENQLTSGIDLSDDAFAISTVAGGSIILNKKSGGLINILDINSGLPDNEIYALGRDQQGGLWLSHGFGISRINYNLPVKDYNNYKGLEGNIIDVTVVNNKTYIATNQGIYYQDSAIQIKETEKVKPKAVKKTKIEVKPADDKEKNVVPDEKKIESNDEPLEIKSDTKSKKGLFQKWKEKREEKKRNKNIGTKAEPEKVENEIIVEPALDDEMEKNQPDQAIRSDKKSTENEKTDKSFKTEKKSQIWTVTYLFRKVKNVNGKCKQLVRYGDLILAATNNGLYEINNNSSQIILKNEYVNYILPSKSSGLFYIGTDRGITAIKREKNKWVEYPKIRPKGFNDPVYTIAEDENRNIWLGNDNEVLHLIIGKNLSTISFEMYDFGNEYPEKFSIRLIDNSIFFLSSGQIYRFNTSNNKIEPNNLIVFNKYPLQKYIVSQYNISWLRNQSEWICETDRIKPTKIQIALLNLFDNIQNIYVDDKNNLWVVDGNNKLFKILSDNRMGGNGEEFKVYVKRIVDDYGNPADLNQIKIGSEVSSLSFTMAAPYYLKPGGTSFQYMIKDKMNGWSEWNSNHEFPYIVEPGTYKVQIKAKNILNEISISEEYKLVIQAPFWKKEWFIILTTSILIFLLSLSYILLQKKREKKLQRDNKRLEAKVEERTNEIVKQKEQIEYKNREITDSINYASQIQTAILPPYTILKDSLEDSFVLNMPKDIVSGDFYWANKVNEQLVVTAADCTGHGVPGAFLSLLGVTFLNEISNKMQPLRANLILELLRERVIYSLHQGGFNKKRLDGIDLSLAIIDLSKMQLQFAGANNSIFMIRNGYLSEFKGNRMPIGLHAHKDKPFTNHNIDIKKGDKIYLFSDGYIDQFGGEFGRKFLSKNFKTLLTEIFQLPMDEQCDILKDIIDSWKTGYEQIDDILVVGLKI